MEPSPLVNYFTLNLQRFKLHPSTITSIHSTLTSINKKCKSKRAKNPTPSLEPLIYKIHLKESTKIQENIRKQKLKNVEKIKEDLQTKLLFISQSIGELQIDDYSESLKKKALAESKKIKFDPFDKEKAQVYAEELKRFADLRKRSENMIKIQSEKVMKKAKELEERENQTMQEKKLLREQFRKEELEKFRHKREIKTKEIESIKSSQLPSPGLQDKKPLFLKLEENYKLNYEMPELEKRKEELKKKSLFFMPIHHESIKEHNKWYTSIKEANAQKIQREISSRLIDSQIRSTSVSTNSWALRLMEEERKAEEEKFQRMEEKRKLLQKKAKYSELIKEIIPITARAHKKSGSLEKKKKGLKKKPDSETSVSKNWKPHKFETNKMVPKKKATREPKQVMYLEEKRVERANRSNSPDCLRNLEDIVQKGMMKGSATSKELKRIEVSANRLDDIARKKELISETKHLTVSSVQKAADVDKLLITSIRAKLHILENL